MPHDPAQELSDGDYGGVDAARGHSRGDRLQASGQTHKGGSIAQCVMKAQRKGAVPTSQIATLCLQLMMARSQSAQPSPGPSSK